MSTPLLRTQPPILAANVAPPPPTQPAPTNTHTQSTPNVVGIIFPPAEMRQMIDTTAQFVARTGPELENRVMREKRFPFLFPNNPYRPYYDLKVKEFQTGVEDVAKPTIPEAIMDMRKQEEEAQNRKQKILALKNVSEKQIELKPPEPDQYVVNTPPISPIDIDVIKTTAQFVARNGQRFLTGLTHRERNNPQFDFLNPSHQLFTYFTSMVDSYTKCLVPPKEQINKLKIFNSDFTHILDMCVSRYKWEEEQEKIRREREEVRNEERNIMASIDWHDFVVVETIDFTTEDDSLPLAAPIDFTSNQIKILAPLETSPLPKPTDTTTPAILPGLGEIVMEDEDMEVELDGPILEEEPPQPPEELHTPPIPPPEPVKAEIHPTTAGEMKIVSGYTRPRKTAPQQPVVLQKCPLTGQMIPADKMNDHLNTLLLDPRWKEEHERRKEKLLKQSNYAPTGVNVGSYLSAFASKRPDMFGSVEEEIKEHSDSIGTDVPSNGTYDPAKGSMQFGKKENSSTVTHTQPPPSNSTRPGPMEPPLKKRTISDDTNISESQFQTMYPGNISYQIRSLESEGLPTQTFVINAEVKMTIKQVKELLFKSGIKTTLTIDQIRLRDYNTHILLQDDKTLAAYNLGPNNVIQVSKI